MNLLQGVKDLGTKIYNGVRDIWNDFSGQTSEDERTRQTNEANLQAVQSTNETNKQIADENLEYQRELQEYNAALQQQIFEREDTSYQRTAQDMLNAGLNPLSMQGTNGAGEAIAQVPLNNQFQAQAPQFQKSNVMGTKMQALKGLTSGLMEIANTFNALKTGAVTRDKLNMEKKYGEIDHILQNIGKGVFVSDDGKPMFDDEQFDKFTDYMKSKYEHDTKSFEHDVWNWTHDEETNRYASDTNIERMLTAVEDWVVNGRGEEAWNKLKTKFPLLKMLDDYAKFFFNEYYSEPKVEVYRYGKNGKEILD